MSDLTIDLLDRTETPTPAARIASWIRVAEVTFVAVVLLSLSFVLGRLSNDHSAATHAQISRTAPAGLSPEAERAAQARLVRANGTDGSGSAVNGTADNGNAVSSNAVNSAGHNLLSLCPVGVPC